MAHAFAPGSRQVRYAKVTRNRPRSYLLLALLRLLPRRLLLLQITIRAPPRQ